MKRETFNLIRHELNKLESLPPWGRAQGDQWDRLSSFVYQVKTLQGVQRQAQAVAQAHRLNVEAFVAYALRRWFNHHTHDQILQIFYAHPDVKPEDNRKHHSIDFYLRSIPFDLKVSTFPKAYPKSLKHAWQHRHELALWQYENQSKQGRYHTGNRFFIILHHRSQPDLSWQLRRDFESLERLIQEFLTLPALLGLTLTNPKTQEIHQPWAAVIFHIK
ncbi:MAG: hypothetical protein BroJett011_36670 [Chloroflexota bacterium]|nr:MAG: hypothetical protein BroJett011_36670 [Chloroflexota bacterium]